MPIAILLLTSGLLVFVSAGVQHLTTVSSKGLGFVFTDRSTPLSRDGFAGRAARTLQNNIESAGMVVPAAIVLLISSADSVLITLPALAYCGARIGFTWSYWLGASRMRSLFWGLGMAAIAALTIQAALRLPLLQLQPIPVV